MRAPEVAVPLEQSDPDLCVIAPRHRLIASDLERVSPYSVLWTSDDFLVSGESSVNKLTRCRATVAPTHRWSAPRIAGHTRGAAPARWWLAPWPESRSSSLGWLKGFFSHQVDARPRRYVHELSPKVAPKC